MTCLGQASWPPDWKGPYGPDKPLPRGEAGVLVRVEAASNILTNPHCIIVMQWNDQEYIGSLHLDEEEFFQKIVSLLRSCVGRPIAEIGGLDVP